MSVLTKKCSSFTPARRTTTRVAIRADFATRALTPSRTSTCAPPPTTRPRTPSGARWTTRARSFESSSSPPNWRVTGEADTPPRRSRPRPRIATSPSRFLPTSHRFVNIAAPPPFQPAAPSNGVCVRGVPPASCPRPFEAGGTKTLRVFGFVASPRGRAWTDGRGTTPRAARGSPRSASPPRVRRGTAEHTRRGTRASVDASETESIVHALARLRPRRRRPRANARVFPRRPLPAFGSWPVPQVGTQTVPRSASGSNPRRLGRSSTYTLSGRGTTIHSNVAERRAPIVAEAGPPPRGSTAGQHLLAVSGVFSAAFSAVAAAVEPSTLAPELAQTRPGMGVGERGSDSGVGDGRTARGRRIGRARREGG